jgi:hypothetical protein
MPDALDNRLALLRLAAELRQATARAERAIDGGDAAAMLTEAIALSHNLVSAFLVQAEVSRDVERFAHEAAASEARQEAARRRSLRDAMRMLAIDLAHEVSRALRAKR